MLTLNSHYRFIIVAVSLLIHSFAYSGEPEISFQRITINDGLSLSSVYAIYQDSKGFMWFATEDGLNKYDGQNFTIYNHTPGRENTLSYKWVECITEDQYGIIWLSSRNGLSRLDPATDRIEIYQNKLPGSHALSNDTITCILEFDSYLWVGTMDGLNRIHTRNLRATEVIPSDNFQGLKIYDFHADKNHRLWVGTNQGLFLILPGQNEMKQVLNSVPGTRDPDVYSLKVIEDSIWIGGDGSLVRYNINKELNSLISIPKKIIAVTGQVERIFPDSRKQLWVVCKDRVFIHTGSSIDTIIETPHQSPSLAVQPKKPIFEAEDGSIWIGTFGDGSFRIIPEGNEVHHYYHDPTNNASLSDNTINSIFQDRAGAIWFGTFGAGISIYNPHANLIRTLRHSPFTENSLSSSFMWSIFEDQAENLWIGTNSTGLNIFLPEIDSFIHIHHDPENPESLPDGAVREVFQAENGSVWIGTDGGGLSKYKAPDLFQHFTNNPEDPGSISSNSVRTIFEDSTGILWIGTRHGLNKFNPKTGNFKQYLHDPNDPASISHNFVYSAIYMDKRGDLWIGTYGGGLNKLDTKNDIFTSYEFDAEDPSSLSDNIVFSIYEDEKGYFWIGTNSGLNLFNPSTGKFKRYGVESGLPNEVIYGILPDENNMLWITTNKGVSRLDLTEFHFKNFDVRDGLQSNEFNGGAFHRGQSGKIYVGGVYGLSIIEPDKIKPLENNAEIIISRLEILGKDVQVLRDGMLPDSSESTESLIEMAENYFVLKHLAYLDEIRLHYQERFFSIEFAALNHHISDKLNFRYRMLGLHEHWSYAGNRNNVTYANMKPGSYIFQVEASNPDGKLTGNPAELKIVITPPFWRSYWFILLLVMVAILLIVFVYRYLLNQRTTVLLKEQNTQITQANNQLQESENNLRSLNATKDKFFSIISHDLKNPFASVLSISELLDQNFAATEQEEMQFGIKKIHTTNKHIYELLENLLTWSKTQRGNLKVEKVKFNVSKVVETNLNILRLSAEKKKLNIVNNTPEDICALGDREMISTVFRNLLNNAIKFTPGGKEIIIDTEKDSSLVTIKVSDQGVGIEEKQLARLFKIEEKIKTDGTEGEKGTGLGLVICKEFVEKNGGVIKVSSTPGKGSIFSFCIPVAQS